MSCTELKLEILEAAPGAAPEPYVEDFNCTGLLGWTMFITSTSSSELLFILQNEKSLQQSILWLLTSYSSSEELSEVQRNSLF